MKCSLTFSAKAVITLSIFKSIEMKVMVCVYRRQEHRIFFDARGSVIG
jgi:hypothetical protein